MKVASLAAQVTDVQSLYCAVFVPVQHFVVLSFRPASLLGQTDLFLAHLWTPSSGGHEQVETLLLSSLVPCLRPVALKFRQTAGCCVVSRLSLFQ